jgi:DNA invertase Pin-like site-specific DNA recombinase
MTKQRESFYKDKLIEMRDALISTTVESGVSVTDTAFIFKISKQRVSQIINDNNKNNDRRK